MTEHCSMHSAHAQALGRDDKRLNDHSEMLAAINQTQATTNAILNRIVTDVKGIDDRLRLVEGVGGRNWDAIVKSGLQIGVSLLLGFLAAKLGLR